MNKFICSDCGTKYSSPETTPPPGIKWNDGHVCTPKLEEAKILENILEDDYDLNVQFHKIKRECIFSFVVAHYNEKLTFQEWEKEYYGDYIEQPKLVKE